MVFDLTTHAAAARELSLGFIDALAFLTRGRSEIEEVLNRHHAFVESELPGF